MWNYRIRKSISGDDSWLGVVEYFETPSGPAWSADDEAPIGADIDELVMSLERMLEAARKAKENPGLIFEDVLDEEVEGA